MDDAVLFLQDLAVMLLSASLAGFLCRKIGLSPVVGYLGAGLMIGTPEIVFPYVSDQGRVGIIAQLGVVFLMFSIGLQFGLRRIRELGFRVVLSTLAGALLIFSAVRLGGEFLSLTTAGGIALAAVFMNSSSAIISRVVEETGLGHERPGQLALAITLIEDILAVLMLTILGSYLLLGSGTEGSVNLPLTVLLIAGFAVLVFVVGTLLLPKLLPSVSSTTGGEAVTVLIAGTLFGSAYLAVSAGYSIALGAFLLGMVVAETGHKAAIERNFAGLRDLFLTIFFVSIGMMVDAHSLPGVAGWVVVGVLCAVFGRSLAVTCGLLLIGEHPRTAVRTALCVTPLGEFSFILAGVAVAGGIFSDDFQAMVVGVVLGTSLLTPILAGRGEKLTRFLAEGRWPLLDRVHALYGQLLRAPRLPGRSALIWELCRSRIGQAALELLLLSTVVIFAGRLFTWLQPMLPQWFSPYQQEALFWGGLGLLCIFPLFLVWRNLSAVAMILAESLNRQRGHEARSVRFFSGLLRFLAATFLALWLWNILPDELPRNALLGVTLLLAVPLLIWGWRGCVRWHTEIETTLREQLGGSKPKRHLFDNWRDEGWGLNVTEILLPEDSALAGCTMAQLNLRARTGCSVIQISRQNMLLPHVGASTQIFPGDELLLLGEEAAIPRARELLLGAADATASAGEDERVLKSYLMPPGTRAENCCLRELHWARDFGVQVLALLRAGVRHTGHLGEMKLQAGDALLLLGGEKSILDLVDANEADLDKTAS